jgi:predicted nucleic acid-binding protein
VVVTYLIDTSALHRLRHPPVAAVLGPLIESGRVAMCPVSELETLYSARNLAEYEAGFERFRIAFTWVPVAERAWDRAAQVQHELAKRGQHRAASVPDLLLAATAELNKLTVLHYDRDLDTISAVTGQPTQWVVPAGTVD